MSVKAVVFDAENVLWDGFSREMFLDPNTPANEAIDFLKRNQYITESDLKNIKNRLRRYGKITINALGLLGDLIGGPWYRSECTVENMSALQKSMDKKLAGISQCFNPGLKMRIIREYANEIPLIKGSKETLQEMGRSGIYRLASTSGIAPFLYAVTERLGGVDGIEAPETVVCDGRKKSIFTPEMLREDGIKMYPEFRGEYERFARAREMLVKTGLGPKDVLYVESCEPDFREIKKAISKG